MAEQAEEASAPHAGGANVHKKGAWTPDEDAALEALVKQHGTKSWGVIAAGIAGRSGKSCRLRWHNQLNPEVNKLPFSEWEQAVIIRAQEVHQNRWAAIARLLVGRTDNSVKNHWHATLHRKVQNGSLKNKYVEQGVSLDWLLQHPEVGDARDAAARSAGLKRVLGTRASLSKALSSKRRRARRARAHDLSSSDDDSGGDYGDEDEEDEDNHEGEAAARSPVHAAPQRVHVAGTGDATIAAGSPGASAAVTATAGGTVVKVEAAALPAVQGVAGGTPLLLKGAPLMSASDVDSCGGSPSPNVSAHHLPPAQYAQHPPLDGMPMHAPVAAATASLSGSAGTVLAGMPDLSADVAAAAHVAAMGGLPPPALPGYPVAVPCPAHVALPNTGTSTFAVSAAQRQGCMPERSIACLPSLADSRVLDAHGGTRLAAPERCSSANEDLLTDELGLHRGAGAPCATPPVPHATQRGAAAHEAAALSSGSEAGRVMCGAPGGGEAESSSRGSSDSEEEDAGPAAMEIVSDAAPPCSRYIQEVALPPVVRISRMVTTGSSLDGAATRTWSGSAGGALDPGAALGSWPSINSAAAARMPRAASVPVLPAVLPQNLERTHSHQGFTAAAAPAAARQSAPHTRPPVPLPPPSASGVAPVDPLPWDAMLPAPRARMHRSASAGGYGPERRCAPPAYTGRGTPYELPLRAAPSAPIGLLSHSGVGAHCGSELPTSLGAAPEARLPPALLPRDFACVFDSHAASSMARSISVPTLQHAASAPNALPASSSIAEQHYYGARGQQLQPQPQQQLRHSPHLLSNHHSHARRHASCAGDPSAELVGGHCGDVGVRVPLPAGEVGGACVVMDDDEAALDASLESMLLPEDVERDMLLCM